MILDRVNNPQDLKNLEMTELSTLAEPSILSVLENTAKPTDIATIATNNKIIVTDDMLILFFI